MERLPQSPASKFGKLEDKMGSCVVHPEGIIWPELQKACANISSEHFTKGFLQPVSSH